MSPTLSAQSRDDLLRLRASLRLCFPPEEADRLATRAALDAADPVRALAPIVRMARLRYTTNRWLSVVSRRRTHREDRPSLHPRLGLPADSALILAIHLGLGLDLATLVRLFHKSAADVAIAVQRARQTLDPEHAAPCPDSVAAIGRYRFPPDNRVARLELLQHLEGCHHCQCALNRARKTDEQLLVAINQAHAGLPDAPGSTASERPLWLGPALLWSGVGLLALVFVIAVGIGSHRLLDKPHVPVSLVAARTASSPISGWLLEASPAGSLGAINLATGRRRLLIPAAPDATSSMMLSPDYRRVAVLEHASATSPHTSVRIYQIDGTLLHEWSLSSESTDEPVLGWLDANLLLLTRASRPTPSETSDHYRARLPTIAQLLTLNVETGTQKVILDGQVNAAYVSPDGRFVAMDRTVRAGDFTLEIRSVTAGKLGRPIATFDQSVYSVFWTRDNAGVAFLVPPASPSGTDGAVDFLALTGRLTTLVQLTASSDPALLGVAPDGQAVIYASNSGSVGVHAWDYWEVSAKGDAPKQLAADSASIAPGSLVWSPDGTWFALSGAQPVVLANPQQGSAQTSVTTYVIRGFTAQGDSVGAVFSEFTDRPPLAWLPEDAVAEAGPPQSAAGGSFHGEGVAKDIGVKPQLTKNSRVSPDGTKALIYDATYDFSMAAPIAGGGPTGIAGAPIDPSWLPDSTGAIAVEHHTVNGGTISRIAIYGQANVGGGLAPVDFDPAQLGNGSTATYHAPMLAPNGLRYSFFVVDGPRIALWIGGSGLPPRVVEQWSLSIGAKIAPSLIALWVDNDTLIFTEPADWSDGLPQRALLRRVTLATGESRQVDTLLTWHPNGNETGIVLQELRLSSDQSHIAFRLRHYTGTNIGSDRFDSISVAQRRNLIQSIEIARGSSGDGMSWSPAGGELVAAIKDGLQVMSRDGSKVQTVDTGSGVASYPLWVSPNEIWYESGTGNAAQVMVLQRGGGSSGQAIASPASQESPDALLVAAMRAGSIPSSAQEVKFSDAVTIRKLYADVLELPPYPMEPHFCPEDNGIQYHLQFLARQKVLLEATVQAEGCQRIPLSNGLTLWAGDPRGASFWSSLARLLGASLDDLRSGQIGNINP